jgi:hypothetical protein
MTTNSCQYRGYEIVPRREWAQWCASIYTTRSDLPILSRSTLRTLSSSPQDALQVAKKHIDQLLSNPP